MKIAVYHNLPSGGAHRILHGLCRYLSQRHRVDIYTLSTSDQELLRDADVADQVFVTPFCPRGQVTLGLYVNDVRRRLDLRDLGTINDQIARTIDSRKYDAVFVEACRFTFAPRVLRSLETPSAFYYNGSPPWVEGHAWKPPRTALVAVRRALGLPLEWQLERRLRREDATNLRAATAVFTNSKHSRGRVAENYGVEARLVRPGVNLLPTRTTDPQIDGDYVLSVGSLENRKGFDFLVRAIASMDRPKPRLVIASNGADPLVRRRLETQAARQGVEIEILLDVRDDPLSALYAGAKAFVFGSHDEPLGMAPLEAMAHGTPVVAVAEGGVPETVEDGETGFLVPRDPVRFAEAVDKLTADERLRSTMGEAGRRLISRRWEWDIRGPVYEQELQLLAAR